MMDFRTEHPFCVLSHLMISAEEGLLEVSSAFMTLQSILGVSIIP